jgi:nitroreductase
MELGDVIRSRRSIRKFRTDPVPESMVREILDEARWAPSWTNTQCWDLYVVTGAPLERIKAANVAMFDAAAISTPDGPMPGREWPERYAERTRRMMARRLPTVGASETGAAPEPALSMPALYGAPCLLAFTVDKALMTEYACFDTALMVENVCLAAYGRGLGTCIMAMAVRDPDALRELLPGAAEKQFVIGVALGYPDQEDPVNRFERPRAPLEELVTWTG